MGDFEYFIKLGFEHIADLRGYDHILFIVALCAVYTIKDWKSVLWMVTAFTIGHSITLALATFDLVHIPSKTVDRLIPATILITAISNIFITKEKITTSRNTFKYVIATVFGLIHGLGFSNFLRSILARDESIITQLFAFNLGLEIGQLVIVAATLFLALIFVDLLKAKKREWSLVLSAAAGGIAIILILGL
jgi:hydrogenase/urease accessory protein HupE